MDAKKSNLRSWDSNEDFLRRILKQHSSSQATVQILQSQLQRLKTLKGTSKESLQKSKFDEELMENSTNDLIFSTSQTFDTTNKQQDDNKLLCSTMMYNKTNNLNLDNFGDDFSPIKENVKIEEFIDSQDNLISEDSASHSYECEEKVDELSSLFETIMKTGEKLKKELKDSRRRERILSDKISDSNNSQHFTKSQPLTRRQPRGAHDVTNQLDWKFQCSKLENALLSLQNENLKLNRLLKSSHRPSMGNHHKLPQVADVISRLRESEIEKVEMQLEMEKMKNFIKESNLKKCSCDRMKVDELKSSLRKSHEMLEEGIDQRKQLHSLLAHKESQLTDMQVKIDKLECALQTSTNKMKLLQQQDNSKTSEQEGISKNEIEDLLLNYEKLKQVHLQTLKDFHDLGRRVKEEADEKAKQASITNAKKSLQTEKSTFGGKTCGGEILGETASSIDEKLNKARGDYPSYLQLRADQVNIRHRHHDDVSMTSQSGADGTFVEESTPRYKFPIASTTSTSSCINDLVKFRPHRRQSTPIRTKEEEKSQAASLPPHEFCTRNNTTGASTHASTSDDLPTDTMSLLEKFHDFTVALVDQDGLANSAATAGRQTSTYQQQRGDLQVDELLRRTDVTTSRHQHQVKDNEVGFSNSQQEYVDGLVEKYNRLARDRW